MNALRCYEFVADELGGTEEEGKELVVVEAPDTVGAGGLEIVCHLYFAHEAEVAGEDDERERGKCGGWEEVEPVKAEQPEDEVELMPRAVVYA